MDVSPSLGLVLGLPIGILVIVVGVLVAVIGAWRDEWDRNFWLVGGLGIAAAAAVITAIAMWPYNYEYHSWHTETGVVAETNSRFLPSGKSVEQKFVVRFADGRERGVQDTRASLVKAGDSLTIRCKRAWQFSGTDGWDCAYVSSRPGGGK